MTRFEEIASGIIGFGGLLFLLILVAVGVVQFFQMYVL